MIERVKRGESVPATDAVLVLEVLVELIGQSHLIISGADERLASDGLPARISISFFGADCATTYLHAKDLVLSPLGLLKQMNEDLRLREMKQAALRSTVANLGGGSEPAREVALGHRAEIS
jgi:hypothetical protein